MRSRITHWLAHPRWSLALMLLALGLSLPALTIDLAMDDYILRAKQTGEMPMPAGSTPYLELFRFVSGKAEIQDYIKEGKIPWWSDPQIRVAFFRPLSVASHQLDHALWPETLVLHHLHSLLWYALAVWVVLLLYRRMGHTAAAAGLAGLLFAIDDAHVLPVAWLSNRNALMALSFGLAAVIFHRSWQRGNSVRWLALALIAVGAGLLSGEVALGAVGYIAAHQLLLDQRPWSHRLLRLTPYLGLVLAWGAIYSALGFGATGSGVYVDPVSEPGHFLATVLLRGPALMFSLWTQVPSDILYVLPPKAHLLWSGAGLVVLLGLSACFAPLLKQSAEARFWAAGMLLSLIPVCGTIPMDRLLLLPSVGAFGLLACQVERWGWLDTVASLTASNAPQRWTIKGLLLLHIVIALPLLPIRIQLFHALTYQIDRSAIQLPSDDAVPQHTFVILSGVDIFYIYSPLIRQAHGRALPKKWALLTSGFTSFEATRPDANSLIIRPEGGFLAKPGEQLFRGMQHPFHVGERMATDTMDIEVQEVTDDSRPGAVRFHFQTPLEHPSLRWFYMVAADLKPFPLPQIGASVAVKNGLPTFSDLMPLVVR